LQDVSFDVADGEFCILVGPSGCGKSTLLRLIAGLEQPSGGEIFIGAERVDALAPRERDVAFVFQNYALYPHLTVFENLAFSLRLRGISRIGIGQKVKEAAQLLEIEDSEWRWAGPSSASRGFFSSMSRSRISTRRCAPACALSWRVCIAACEPRSFM
jgi:ABC-type sugar transport system ATPase subunit